MYEDAYPVPFRLERRPPVYRFVNDSAEAVHGVAVIIHGAGTLAANSPAKLQPGEELEVTIDDRYRQPDSLLVVRWFRPDGVEYLWRAKL